MTEIKKIYRKIYWSAVSCVLSVCYFLQPQRHVGIAVFFILMGSGLCVLKFSLDTISILPGRIPLLPLCAGLFLIIGGAIFDVAITIIYSPDLTQEANHIVRFFFDLDLSLSQIYWLGLMGQTLYVSILSMLWANFLKAYPILLQQIQPTTFAKTFISIFGGPHATKLDLFVGKVDCFFYVSSLTPMLVALSLYRWYLGLEWLALVPISRIIAPITIAISAVFFYVYISHRLLIKDCRTIQAQN